MKPLVSISVITFNHEKYIKKALDSFLMQKTEFPFEILIHDDASTDKTQDIIKEYEEKYPEIIRAICQEKNQYSQGFHNVSAYFNYPRAEGKYIAFCEGDDYWIDPLKLQKQVSYMEAHPDCSLTIHGADLITESEEYIKDSRPFSTSKIVTMEEVVDARELFPSASMVFRSEDGKNLPEFYYNAPVGDIPLHLFLATRGYVYYFDEKMSIYRLGGAGSWTTAIKAKENLEKKRQHNLALQKLFEEFNQYTEKKYENIVEYTKNRLQLGYLLDGGRYKEAMSKKYKQVWDKELTGKEKIYVTVRRFTPEFIFRILRRES